MSIEHLFVIDPLASLNVTLDSSLRMMAALARRGQRIHVCEPRQLYRRNGDLTARARATELHFGGEAGSYEVGATTDLALAHMAAVHMRKDPPYDLDYITCTWLLSTATAQGIRVYNSPEALRRHNEKLAILDFPAACRSALVSSDPEQLLAFAESDARGDAILKPLTLFGGRGVERLEVAVLGRDQALARLRDATDEGQRARLIQAFDPAIFSGEVRVFTAFGQPIAWCLKRPAPGQYLANTRMGATLSPYTPTPDEVRRVETVARALATEGAVLLGFDLIGGYVSEINLTSPRLLQAGSTSGLASQAPYDQIADLMLRDLS